MKVLIGGVGYTNLHDLSVGPTVVDRLRALRLPEQVEVEDLNHLVAAYQSLSREPYDRVIIVGAVRRGSRPGEIRAYGYEQVPEPPDEDEIRVRVAEGVAGTVDLDSLLMLCRYYGVLPRRVRVIEVEPDDEDWGEGFTPPVAEAVEKVLLMLMQEAGMDTVSVDA